MKNLKIGIACDHAGFALKQTVITWLQEQGVQVTDYGCPSTDSCAYPDFAHPMADSVEKAYDAMIENLKASYEGRLNGIANAYNAEDRINNLRNILRDEEIEDIENNRRNYQTSVYYMDIVNELEKMGDFIINISQDLEKCDLHN